VDLEPAPGLFQHVQDVPLGDALLHPPSEDRGGPLAGGDDRLVGSEQQDPCLFELVFDLRAVVGDPGQPVDGLADHGLEPSIAACCFGEQVVDATVPGDRQVELGVGGAVAAPVQVGAPGLDVVEVRHDHHAVRQAPLAGRELAR
jgi:hypothetical protein